MPTPGLVIKQPWGMYVDELYSIALPSLTASERDNLSSPATGFLLYNTTLGRGQIRDATGWQDIASGGNTIGGGFTVGGGLIVSGGVTASGGVTVSGGLDVTGDSNVSNLDATGTITLSGGYNLEVSGPGAGIVISGENGFLKFSSSVLPNHHLQMKNYGAGSPSSGPGASYGSLRWQTGTNSGTLKLVAYSGTSTTGVTVVDNVGSGN